MILLHSGMRISVVALVALVLLSFSATSASAYTVGPPSPGLIETGEQIAKEGVERRQHEEAEAAARKSAEERASTEVREREERAAAEAKPTQESVEREARERLAPTVVCRVPKLKGHSLSAARRLLADAHCALGHVRAQRGNRAAQVVVSQGTSAGASRAAGAAVTVTLARRR
ncbi:MAG TPA: hypothetical protein VK774_04075 [Solirubrobacteraceae bacterium]|nr:hypothetical protein [Solirubrobacteraceae bacterium]